MCGGLGTRLESDREKPLHPICGTPMVERVLAALEGSRIERIYAAVSPHAPATRAHLEREVDGSASILETPGEGYVADLTAALESDALEPPVLTVAADLPLLASAAVDRLLARHETGSTTVCVPVALKRRLGVSVDTTLSPHLAPTGVNVVGAPNTQDMTHVSYDSRLAINVNRIEDTRVAERHLTRQEGDECA
ncbi:NTP transferase domain-containing protein [Natrialbaceae archaeon AArc-T1-2]|uniref:NTP transferase domain-containing protein n=1 Tax=Natrialbaceae archaeon AArc-T1-2 TaxID=3053904 RepID=UPI00255B1203|nr:NTP transferase domain-containing protein [Natrialbaceae archaeon AArc-T1-2]WIV68650.1 NTP transferase domain-containing protein [Natrialbaceae archaeon AArc-T1-2]